MRFMSASQAAAALTEYGVSESQLKRGAAQGRFPCIRVGSRTLIDVDAAAAILDQAHADEQLLNTDQLSEATGLSASAIRRGVAEGWIPTRDARGRHLRFDLDDVRAALERQMRANMGEK